MKTRTIPSIFTVLLSSAALAVVAIGCGGSDDANGPGNSGGVYTLDDVCEKVAQRQCADIQSCCDSTGIGFDQAGCIAQTRSQCEASVRLVKEGKRTFHPEAVDACQDLLASTFQKCELTMEDLLDFGFSGTVCQRVFAGTVEVGGACTAPEDCKPPTGQDQFAICDAGKCDIGHINVQEGGDCGTRGSCAAGLYCELSSSGGIATTPTGKCRQLKEVGADCASAALLGGDCGPSLYCDLSSDTCQPLKDVGEDCETSLECKSHVCNGTCGEGEKHSMADEQICLGASDDS